MEEHQYSDVEKLAIMQAIYSEAASYVSTKDPHSLRCEVDRAYKELYEATGAKSFEVKINGNKVGTYSVKMSKPKPSEAKVTFEVESYEDLARWFQDDCMAFAARYVSMHLKEFAEWYFADTGELPDGCVLRKTVTTATNPQYLGGTLKIDNESVVSAVGNVLEAGIGNLLLGGEHD